MKQKKKGLGLSMLLGTLGSSLLGNQLTSEEVKVKTPWWEMIRAGAIRGGQDF